MPKEFHICTIANRLAEYAKMKEAFIHAGFMEDRCDYSLFDNSTSNSHDPYQTISHVLETSNHRYVIFCHQDVRPDQGAGFNELLQTLAELDRLSPSWCIAGNAGVTETGEFIARITDPHGVFASGDLPRKVYSLDENFIVIRTAAGLKSSADLSGFHLYATDLCFNGMCGGGTCHVIDFHMTHLSAGDPSSATFSQSLSRFTESWNARLVCGIVETATLRPLRLGRYKILRQIISQPIVERQLRCHDLVFIPFARAGRLWQISCICRFAMKLLTLIVEDVAKQIFSPMLGK